MKRTVSKFLNSSSLGKPLQPILLKPILKSCSYLFEAFTLGQFFLRGNKIRQYYMSQETCLPKLVHMDMVIFLPNAAFHIVRPSFINHIRPDMCRLAAKSLEDTRSAWTRMTSRCSLESSLTHFMIFFSFSSK